MNNINKSLASHLHLLSSDDTYYNLAHNLSHAECSIEDITETNPMLSLSQS